MGGGMDEAKQGYAYPLYPLLNAFQQKIRNFLCERDSLDDVEKQIRRYEESKERIERNLETARIELLAELKVKYSLNEDFNLHVEHNGKAKMICVNGVNLTVTDIEVIKIS